jgi:hypothetical protein
MTETKRKSTPQAGRRAQPARESRPAARALLEAAGDDPQRQAELLSALYEDLTLSESSNNTANLTPPGFMRLSGDHAWTTLDEYDRLDALQASYYYWQRDPLAGRAIQLIRDYTFGRGVSINAKDPRVQKVVKAFWDDPDNQVIASAAGQWELSERLQLAGEVFPIFFVNRFNGHVKMSIAEPEEINQVITDPDNKRKRLFYERRWARQPFDWQSRVLAGPRLRTDYVPDFGLDPPHNATRGQGAFKRIEHSTVGDGSTFICMHQIKINSHGKRGVPLLLRVLPWVKAYKGFMEDRATLTLALATWAFRQKVSGNKSAVARLAQQWGTYDVANRMGGAGAGNFNRERSEGAQTIIENENVTLDQLRTDSGASNAYQDGRMLRQQVGAGLGITEQNLTGDPSVANLASATQMEGPMLKMFESWQQLFHDEFLYILNFVVAMAIEYGDLDPEEARLDANGYPMEFDPTIEIDFPPIVTADLAVFIGAISSLINAQAAAGQEYVAPDRLARYILQAFGETDIDTALQELRRVMATAPAAKPAPGTPAPHGAALPDQQATAIKAAIEALQEAAYE